MSSKIELTNRAVRIICGNFTETLNLLGLNDITDETWYEDCLYPLLRDYWLEKLGLDDEQIRR